jgi:hypothetical protein
MKCEQQATALVPETKAGNLGYAGARSSELTLTLRQKVREEFPAARRLGTFPTPGDVIGNNCRTAGAGKGCDEPFSAEKTRKRGYRHSLPRS